MLLKPQLFDMPECSGNGAPPFIGECIIFGDYDLNLRLWTAGYMVAHVAFQKDRDGHGGSTHDDSIPGLKCWHKNMVRHA